MSRAASFIFRRRGSQMHGRGWHWTDIVTWLWLIGGLIVMFGPALWLVFSSFKTPAALAEFPPSILPYASQQVTVAGHDQPLTLYDAKMPDGTTKRMAEIRRIGLFSQMIDPADPGAPPVRVNIDDRQPVRELSFATENYTEPFVHFDFFRYLWNSVFVTVMATVITLVVNSMAAFALSKYEFRGRSFAMLIILATLMVPLSVIMVPLYSIISSLGLFNNLWGVILPTVATPTGVFILRQYMLTIPDELLDAARMDKASEWQIYWRIVLPLTAPALAVLAIFSVVWRWNDFLWPLIVLSRKELYTLQVGLSIYSGELNVQWHFILAMTVVTMIPVVLVFIFLQRFITTGIAGSGLK
ncbi:carbohydrate ABC transporter membrane protein 2 (CUT1 family) [Rhizobium sp. PP-F2F-G38]|uniref:carbohydrate ABC transporter permease n=1 Tax=Rhizobium sp. PP-CC-3G-465 TaxID=2135648 RepID=UPI000D93263B|nr:carbohydrate ABC transporter membrane protein 2 (CUT1 family) [Rhizobium sp. PP-F2F-G20b]PYE93560.1 carbohydrate ABC transporter membrane protein 2 (CUT1 family) [Rhizobium sp. PP-F2F-G38]TCP80692.1 carbohydrate ABC transporter membrane protein 2 (CUT1 family) [Rhizobium sp. PP-CC-2G-626]TCQ19338.1 carbohydrate ABC transporter membrane protein 2 (CUT1 family) [Rhizobium sp. PP-CC-3G-465]